MLWLVLNFVERRNELEKNRQPLATQRRDTMISPSPAQAVFRGLGLKDAENHAAVAREFRVEARTVAASV